MYVLYRITDYYNFHIAGMIHGSPFKNKQWPPPLDLNPRFKMLNPCPGLGYSIYKCAALSNKVFQSYTPFLSFFLLRVDNYTDHSEHGIFNVFHSYTPFLSFFSPRR